LTPFYILIDGDEAITAQFKTYENISKCTFHVLNNNILNKASDKMNKIFNNIK